MDFPRSVGAPPASLPRCSAFPPVSRKQPGRAVPFLNTTTMMTVTRRRADTGVRRDVSRGVNRGEARRRRSTAARGTKNRPILALRRGDVDNRRRGEHSSIQNGRRRCAGATRMHARTHARARPSARTHVRAERPERESIRENVPRIKRYAHTVRARVRDVPSSQPHTRHTVLVRAHTHTHTDARILRVAYFSRPRDIRRDSTNKIVIAVRRRAIRERDTTQGLTAQIPSAW